MKFQIGQIVRHRLTNKKYIIIKYFAKRWFRKYPYYSVADGRFTEFGEDKDNDIFDFYECELK